MKKISLLLMLFMGLMACNNDDDMVFSESSTARVQKLQDDCDEMLRSKADGWKMVYVPNPTKQRADEIWGKRTGKDHDRLYGRREQHYLQHECFAGRSAEF